MDEFHRESVELVFETMMAQVGLEFFALNFVHIGFCDRSVASAWKTWQFSQINDSSRLLIPIASGSEEVHHVNMPLAVIQLV
jgi:hypothetical protein